MPETAFITGLPARERLMPRAARGLLVFVLFLLTALASTAAPAQLLVDPIVAEDKPEPIWQPPDLLNLPNDWWAGFATISPDVAEQRFDRFLVDIAARIEGLDPDNLERARSLYDNLESVIDLHLVARRNTAESEFEPLLTRDAYGLDDLLALQAQLRAMHKEQEQLSLQSAQTQRQLNLLVEQRESLLRSYQAATVESPRRILVGIDRIVTRIEHEVARQEIESISKRQSAVTQRADEITRQKTFARNNLYPVAASLDELDSEIANARTRITEASQQVAAVQRQLLDVLSSEPIKPSLEVLRRQQLTRASAQTALNRLEAALLERKAAWYRYRAGEADPRYEEDISTERTSILIEETLKQIEVWSATSQTTLVTTLQEQNLNAQKNLEIARSVAREVLALSEQIRNLSDDLAVVQEILAAEMVRSSSGIGKAWANVKMGMASLWDRLGKIVNYKLFSIGDAPVTLGGLFKALIILLLAYAVSRFIRQLLDHATGREQFSKSPAIYTLGRLLHYIIIIIGVFAALASIGMDFTNFALIAGALSVGIGFGLQAIVNNFVSGLILLFEGSLRIGDYIELDSGLAGVVKEINTRATVVNSNDGVDVVVPNSELVTTKLTNWTLRENVGRLRIPFGVAYGSDKEKVREVALAAAEEMEFVLLHDKGREPQVRLVKFGDSALEFELLAWVSRPGIRRPHRVRASFLWALETHLRDAGIEIPFPQRDLHIKSGAGIVQSAG